MVIFQFLFAKCESLLCFPFSCKCTHNSALKFQKQQRAGWSCCVRSCCACRETISTWT
jgi:hypothetical protein